MDVTHQRFRWTPLLHLHETTDMQQTSLLVTFRAAQSFLVSSLSYLARLPGARAPRGAGFPAPRAFSPGYKPRAPLHFSVHFYPCQARRANRHARAKLLRPRWWCWWGGGGNKRPPHFCSSSTKICWWSPNGAEVKVYKIMMTPTPLQSSVCVRDSKRS